MLLYFAMTRGERMHVRLQVTNAIAECKDAGIRVIMITGDNKLTAEAVARDIGIFGPETDVSGRSITGAHRR